MIEKENYKKLLKRVTSRLNNFLYSTKSVKITSDQLLQWGGSFVAGMVFGASIILLFTH